MQSNGLSMGFLNETVTLLMLQFCLISELKKKKIRQDGTNTIYSASNMWNVYPIIIETTSKGTRMQVLFQSTVAWKKK